MEKSIDICKAFFEELFVPVIERDSFEYKDKIAAGLVGRGSDCFGYDDEISRDHDWGPGFQIYVTKDTYDKIGKDLEKAYDSLPLEYRGFKVAPSVSRAKRRGVYIIEDFYEGLLGKWPINEEDYLVLLDYTLSSAVNGQVFTDPEGIFTGYRNELLKGYPLPALYKKMATSAALFCQSSQYNAARAMKRGDSVTAGIMMYDGLKEAMRLLHFIENKYPPHDKWLFRSLDDLENGAELKDLIIRVQNGESADTIGSFFANLMYAKNIISDVDDYIDHHVEELLQKSEYWGLNHRELVDRVVKAEFTAFDKVNNEGGRAFCQDDFTTFKIMRESQYITWTDEMLVQYLYDFETEYEKGHNLIEEKYGRMMESTAPSEYEKIKYAFPVISSDKKALIEAVIGIQMKMTEDFYAKNPDLLSRARSIHTSEDGYYNTSNETYLRGEISTYSDKMLELYARFIVKLASENRNLTEEIISYTLGK